MEHKSLKALQEIEDFIEDPPSTSRIIDIDPKTAKVLLDERNKGNRPPKPNKVQQFSADIAINRWGLTGDTIKFGSDGRLLDGQNRLAACVRSDKNLRTHVVFNIDPGLFGRMDIGKPRNAADVLHIAGYKYASTLASAVRWAYLIDTNPNNRDTLGPDFVLSLVKNKYPDIEGFLSRGRTINKQYAHPAGQAAALLYKFSKSDVNKCTDFYDAWMTGKRNGLYQIIDTMQALLHSLKVNNNGRIHELVRASTIIKAWNIFKLGQKGSLAQLQAATNSPIEKIG
ncbi:MAG: hypothetical protein EOS55_18675 [Mesorhizobium sp.]|nr:MAG: hypothetical protein EOS55_18675 [Mesorhizobium sp.]